MSPAEWPQPNVPSRMSPAECPEPKSRGGRSGTQPLLTATSSRYIQVSSDGFGPFRCTLNHKVTVCPLTAVRSAVTWVQVPLLLSSLNSVVSVVPVLLRICPSIQSRRQVAALHVRSAVCGWYHRDRVDVPVAGTVMLCESVLSPRGSRPEVTPSRAEPVPPWALVVDVGATTPAAVHDVSADSKPPLATIDAAGAVGVTWDVAAEATDVPTALVAETVKV